MLLNNTFSAPQLPLKKRINQKPLAFSTCNYRLMHITNACHRYVYIHNNSEREW